MHAFGSIGFAYIQNKKKLGSRSEQDIFVGYDVGSSTFLSYFPDKEIKRVRF